MKTPAQTTPGSPSAASTPASPARASPARASAARASAVPASAAARAAASRGLSSRILPSRSILVPVLVFSAVVNVLMLTGSLYMLQVYDRVLTSRSVPTLVGLFVIVVLLYGFLGVFDHLRGRLLARAALRFDSQFGPDAFAASAKGGDTLRDLETLRGGLSGPAVVSLLDLPFVPLFMGMLFLLHPLLGWITVAGAVVSACLAVLSHVVTARIQRQAAGARAAEYQIIEGARRATETLTAMGMLGAVTRIWHGLHNRALAAEQKGSDPAEALKVVSKTFRMLLQSGILTLAAWLVIAGEISAGMIIASSVLSGRALAPIDQIVGQWRGLSRMRESYTRLQAMPADAALRAPAFALPAPAGRLTVHGLGWDRPNNAAQSLKVRVSGLRDLRTAVLADISFDLEPGDALGVIGSSASGKSTLARLLTGVLDPTEGDIRLDGADLGQWSPEQRGEFIGYLPQSVEMMPGSVRDNIARFHAEATDEDVIAAAKLAGVHDMILSLPDGYTTLIGPDPEAVRLSGGQMQRLALARAAYRLPALVVLDEPNSNLDSAGEAALNRTIRALRDAGKTVIVMAHRSAALSQVNRILALDAGRVLAFGAKNDIFALATPGAGRDTPVLVAATDPAATAADAAPAKPSASRPDNLPAVLVAAARHAAQPQGTAVAPAMAPAPRTPGKTPETTPKVTTTDAATTLRNQAKFYERLAALRAEARNGLPAPAQMSSQTGTPNQQRHSA